MATVASFLSVLSSTFLQNPTKTLQIPSPKAQFPASQKAVCGCRPSLRRSHRLRLPEDCTSATSRVMSPLMSSAKLLKSMVLLRRLRSCMMSTREGAEDLHL